MSSRPPFFRKPMVDGLFLDHQCHHIEREELDPFVLPLNDRNAIVKIHRDDAIQKTQRTLVDGEAEKAGSETT